MASLFSSREARALVVFLPLMLIVVLIAAFVRHKPTLTATEELQREMEARDSTAALHPFDPNSVQYEELRELGLTKYEAVSIIRYRKAGKVFRINEDLATCYGISDSLYLKLEPYIAIDPRIALKPRIPRNRYSTETRRRPPLAVTPFLIDTVGVKYLRAIGALSKRQAEAFVRWRDLSGIRDMEELRDCYVVSDSVATALEPYVIFTQRKSTAERLVELNTADSAALRSVFGIGAKTVDAIIEYRRRLGGFHSAEQLAEVKGVTESNFEKILQQISCDSCRISKIDINFATPNAMSGHPYLPPRILRRLLKMRQLKGGWSTVEEMIYDNILTTEEATRLRPYLRFRVHNSL